MSNLYPPNPSLEQPQDDELNRRVSECESIVKKIKALEDHVNLPEKEHILGYN